MRYHVALIHEVDADSPGEAEAVARQRAASALRAVVTEVDIPARHELSRCYVQPRHVLDLAWDQYMDRTLPQELRSDSRTPRLPTLLDLGLAGVSPANLSMLFDLAITAYVQGVGVIPAQVSPTRP
jgi:hypothetical protein